MVFGTRRDKSNVDFRRRKDSNANAGNTLRVDNTSTDSGQQPQLGLQRCSLLGVASSPGNWNSPTNWGYVSDGPGGASVPTSTHTVIFDGANGDNGNCLVNTTVSVATLTISGYAGTFNTQGYNITVSSSFAQSTGNVQLGTSVFTLQGDFIRTGGNFDDGTSTISFTGGQNQNLTSGTTAFFHVAINKSGGAVTLADNLRVDGNWTNTAGTFITGASTVTFGAGASRTIRSSGPIITNLVFNNAGGTWTLQDPLQLTGQLTLTNGTLNTSANNYSVVIASDAILNGGNIYAKQFHAHRRRRFLTDGADGAFSAGGSTVVFTGGINQTFNPGNIVFFNVQFNKTAGTVTLAAPLLSTGSLVMTGGTFDTGSNWYMTVTSNIVINGGTLNLNNSTMSVSRDWLNTVGTINPGGSTVTFSGANAIQNITSGGDSFFNFAINKTSGTVVLQDALDINGAFTLSGGTFTSNSKSISVGGNWNHASGSYIGTGSTVTFNGATANALSGSNTFYALSAIIPSATLTMAAGATQYVSNMLELRNVTLRSEHVTNATWYFVLSGSSQTVVDVGCARLERLRRPNGPRRFAKARTPATTTALGVWRQTLLGFRWSQSTWNTAANWSRTSGGTGSASVPTSTHTVVFDGANGKNGQSNVNIAVNVGTLTISGYTGHFSTPRATTSPSPARSPKPAARVTLTTNTISVGSDFLYSGPAAFTAGSSTITLTGSQNQNINFRHRSDLQLKRQ